MKASIFGCAAILLVAALPASNGAEGEASELDQYGGSTLLKCNGGARGKFYTEKKDDRWWLCTPAGNVFWAMGVYNVVPDNSTDLFGVNHYALVAARYKSGPATNGLLNWSIHTARRLKSWGFNTLDMYAYSWILPWSDQGNMLPKDPATGVATITEKMPAVTSAIKPSHYALYNVNNWADQPVKDLMTGIKSTVYSGWRAVVADYYDERFATWLGANLMNRPPPSVNADWLLGVVVDDTDYLYWAGAGTDFATVPAGKNAPHGGWLALVTSPLQGAGKYNGANQIFTDARVYTKLRLGTYLEGKYGTIDALNAAWGSSYTSFLSTGNVVTGEEVAGGDGVATTLNHRLSQVPVSVRSVQVLLNGKAVAGDNGAGQFLTAGGQTNGSVNYATGEISIVLDEPAAEGSRVTVNYTGCGFGCGTGVLDEDGTHGWVPRLTSTNALTGGTEQARKDLDDFLYQYADQYFGTVKRLVNQYYSGYLYLGPSSLGTWVTPPRKQVLQAASKHLDLIRIVNLDPIKTGPDWLDRLNYYAQWGGDKPWTAWVGARANPDSYFATDPRGAAGGCTTTNFTTQEDRGDWYQTVLRSLSGPTADGTRHLVGINFWQLVDNRSECANWGLVTRRDNPYDGRSAVVAAGTDDWGYATGGEAANYGNFLGSVKVVNSIWMPRVAVLRATAFTSVKVTDARAR